MMPFSKNSALQITIVVKMEINGGERKHHPMPSSMAARRHSPWRASIISEIGSNTKMRKRNVTSRTFRDARVMRGPTRGQFRVQGERGQPCVVIRDESDKALSWLTRIITGIHSGKRGLSSECFGLLASASFVLSLPFASPTRDQVLLK